MPNPEQIRILLVDDHPLVRDGLRARLETIIHFEVVAEAENAAQALHHAATLPIDLALMDINLTGINGIDLTAQYHAAFPHIAVLMLSMHDKAEYVLQSIQAGARGYVLKDAPAIEIITAIDTVMAGQLYYSERIAAQLATTPGPALLLTPRENEILQAIATGKSSRHIAQALDLSVRTVETHRLNIKRKLAIETQADLIRYALDRAPRR